MEPSLAIYTSYAVTCATCGWEATFPDEETAEDEAAEHVCSLRMGYASCVTGTLRVGLASSR